MLSASAALHLPHMPWSVAFARAPLLPAARCSAAEQLCTRARFPAPSCLQACGNRLVGRALTSQMSGRTSCYSSDGPNWPPNAVTNVRAECRLRASAQVQAW